MIALDSLLYKKWKYRHTGETLKCFILSIVFSSLSSIPLIHHRWGSRELCCGTTMWLLVGEHAPPRWVHCHQGVSHWHGTTSDYKNIWSDLFPTHYRLRPHQGKFSTRLFFFRFPLIWWPFGLGLEYGFDFFCPDHPFFLFWVPWSHYSQFLYELDLGDIHSWAILSYIC